MMKLYSSDPANPVPGGVSMSPEDLEKMNAQASAGASAGASAEPKIEEVD